MPYIGKEPVAGNFVLLDSITTSATATYALTKDSVAYSPESARNMIVSLNGVTQAPETAFTVSGSNITFSSALTSSDVIDYILVLGDVLSVGTPSDGTVGTSQMSYPLDNFSSTGIDDNATSTAITIDASENVGIGTTSPTSSNSLAPVLEVKSAGASTPTGFRASNSSASSAFDFFVDGSKATIDVRGGQPFTIETSNTERMRIDSSGNVGIGESTPEVNLHVSSTLRVDGSAPTLQLQESDTTDTNYQIRTISGKLTFQTNNDAFDSASTKVTFDSSGNVGIGTTSPAYELEVKSSSPIVGATSTSSAAPEFRLENTVRSWTNYVSTAGDLVWLDRTGSNETMRIDSSGNVGIGTTSPNNTLQVRGASTTGGPSSGNVARFEGPSGTNGLKIFVDDSANASGLQTIATDDLLLNPLGGNVGIGTSPDASSKLHINSGVGGVAECLRLQNNLATVGGRGSSVVFESSATDIAEIAALTEGASNSGFLRFKTTSGGTSSERMRIDASGNLLVGTTTTVGTGTEGVQIGANGSIITGRNQTSDQIHHIFKNPNGTVGTIRTLNSATSYVTSSDQRLKENIVDAPAGNIDAIRVRSFDWKADGSHQTYGMVAQELVDVAPEAVSQGETEDDMWGVDYSKLVPMMIKEIQDLRARVAQLEGA